MGEIGGRSGGRGGRPRRREQIEHISNAVVEADRIVGGRREGAGRSGLGVADADALGRRDVWRVAVGYLGGDAFQLLDDLEWNEMKGIEKNEMEGNETNGMRE